MTQTLDVARAYDAAAQGAALLDAKLPGWYDILDLSAFHISSADSCVIGQLAQGDMEGFYRAASLEIGAQDYDWGVEQLSGLPSTEGMPANTDAQRLALRDAIAQRTDWCARHGFDLAYGRSYGGETYTALEEAWVWEIARRRHADPDVLWQSVPSDWSYGVQPQWPQREEVQP